jgi:hypothetical protein
MAPVCVGESSKFLSSRNHAVALCRDALATPEAGRQAEYPAASSQAATIARAVAIHKCRNGYGTGAIDRDCRQSTAARPMPDAFEVRPFRHKADSYNPLGAPMAAPLPRACGGAFLFEAA